MPLPGLGLDEPEEIHPVETSHHDLAKETEWRFEVAVGKFVQVKLSTGTAELFGTELVLGNTYTFSGTKAAIYTWHGCSLAVSGDALQSEYTAEETPVAEYMNLHFALDVLREQARLAGRDGPRVLILGPEDAGKTSLAKMLTGYALRAARAPVVVNLDVREGLMSVPGTLTAAVFQTLLDVEEGWGTAPMSGPNGTIPVKLPLVYFFGGARPEEKEGKVYKAQVNRLALAVTGRLAQDADARPSGVIIDTPGALVGTKAGAVGYGIIQDIVSEFAVSVIVCLGSERLYSDMVKRFDGQPTAARTGPMPAAAADTIAVVKVAKSGGCVDRDETFMQAFRAAQVRTYFYGSPRLSNGIALQPRQQQVDFSTLTVWRRVSTTPDPSSTGTGGAVFDNGEDDDDESFLPGGIDDETSGVGASSRVALPSSQIFERVAAPVAALRHAILAVMNCDPDAEQEVLRDSSVMGFLYVTDTDEARGRISLLSPVAGRVPSRAILWAGWPEPVLGMDRA